MIKQMKRLRLLTRVCVLCGALALGLAAGDEPARAQQASAAETERARELYRAGDKAFKEGRYEDARTAFLAAWTFKKNWQLAAALGDSELRTKRYRDAAEHLTYALREGGASVDTARAQGIREALAEAKKHIGELRVTVEPDGADVTVDAALVGRSPLADALYMTPGMHTVEAKKVGSTAKAEKVEARAGTSTSLALKLVREAAPTASTAPVPPPVPSASGSSEPPTVPPVEGNNGKSVPLIVVGASLSAVGIGVGIGLLAASGGAASDRDEQLAALEAREVNPCGAGTTFVDACAEVESLDGDAGNLGLGGAIALGAGAAIGIATLTYALWPSDGPTESARRPVLLPLFSPHVAGAGLRTSF